jgi:hypothetical protein
MRRAYALPPFGATTRWPGLGAASQRAIHPRALALGSAAEQLEERIDVEAIHPAVAVDVGVVDVAALMFLLVL